MLSTKLIQQCKARNITAVRRLIAENADVNAPILDSSPLLAAIETNNVDLLEVLRQAGADIAGFAHHHRTALMVAALEGHVEVVQWLLHHEPVALLDARDDLGCTALILAVQSSNIEVALALLGAGANVAIASNDGTTALTACSGVGMMERLLELGLDIHARDEDGMDALLLACRRGDVEVVSLLIEHRASVYTRDDAGVTALMHACYGGHMRHVAVEEDHPSCLQALVDASADVNKADDVGNTTFTA
jgi:ankyrin repeat protein